MMFLYERNISSFFVNFTHLHHFFYLRYQILAAKKVAKIVDSKKATETIVSTIELDLALYKIGHTKVSKNT